MYYKKYVFLDYFFLLNVKTNGHGVTRKKFRVQG